MEAYCMKCRAKKEMQDARSVIMKNGRPATQGLCPTCGTKMFRIEKREGKTGAIAREKDAARSWLGDVPGDKAFWCHDGRMVKNLEELAAAIREMSEETFRYHATADKNDFSSWVSSIIGDATLASDLRKAADRASAAPTVEARIAWLRART